MQGYVVEGIGSMNGGEFSNLGIEGVGTNQGDIKADKIDIEGVFKSTGSIDAEYMDCEGVADITGQMHIRKIVIEGVVNIKTEDKVEAEDIYCKGCLNSKGDIYAEIFRAEGCVDVRDLFGTEITIESKGKVIAGIKSALKTIFSGKNSHHSNARTIEGGRIFLNGTKASLVRGNEVTIGPDCTIDVVDCSGTLKVHESSTIGEIKGAAVRQDA